MLLPDITDTPALFTNTTDASLRHTYVREHASIILHLTTDQHMFVVNQLVTTTIYDVSSNYVCDRS